jgi:Na+-translocating ferredoxin:NAD+ oxidoreductase RnfD subunit
LLIRHFSGFGEGVMFSILLMNAFAPLIDTVVLNTKYRMARP